MDFPERTEAMKSNFSDQVYSSNSMQEIPFMHNNPQQKILALRSLKTQFCPVINPGASFAIVSQYNDRARQPQLRIQTDCQIITFREKEQFWSMQDLKRKIRCNCGCAVEEIQHCQPVHLNT